MVSYFKKGQIWWYDNGNAHKQDYYTEGNCDILDPRPILIVQDAEYAKWDKTITVITLTGSGSRVGIDIPDFNNKKNYSKMLPYKMYSVSPKFLKEYMGTLDKSSLHKVDQWIKYHLGYSKIKPSEVEEWDNSEYEKNNVTVDDSRCNTTSLKKKGCLKKVAEPLLKRSGANYKVLKVYEALSKEDKCEICDKSIETLSKKFNIPRQIMKQIKQIITRERYEEIGKDGTIVEFVPIQLKIHLIDNIGTNIRKYNFKFDEYKILFSIPDDELSMELKCNINDIRERKREIVNKGIL